MTNTNLMHNPPHPGEFIREVYLMPLGISVRTLAKALGVAASTINRVLNGDSSMSPEMALRLSLALGRSPQSWLAMQNNHDLFTLEKSMDFSSVIMLEIPRG